MECPNCKYKHGWEWKDDKNVAVEGEEGDFYKSPIEMERQTGVFHGPDKERVYGCPKCGSIFMNVF